MINEYKLMKYRAKVDRERSKDYWEEYNSNPGLREDISDENKYLNFLCIDKHKRSDEEHLRTNYNTYTAHKYDGFSFEEMSILGLNKNIDDKKLKEMNYRPYNYNFFRLKPNTLSLSELDTKFRKELGAPGIDIEKFLREAVITTDLERVLIYNNTWGIVVTDMKKDAFPEQIILNTIKEIILEGINSLPNEGRYDIFEYCRNGGKTISKREALLLIWSSAPKDSIAGKTWKLFRGLKYDENNQVLGKDIIKADGEWENYLSHIKEERILYTTKKEAYNLKKEYEQSLNRFKEEIKESVNKRREQLFFNFKY